MTQRRRRPSGEDLPAGYQFGDSRTATRPDRMYLGGGVWRPMRESALPGSTEPASPLSAPPQACGMSDPDPSRQGVSLTFSIADDRPASVYPTRRCRMTQDGIVPGSEEVREGLVWRPLHLNAADRLRPVAITDNGFSVTVPEYETGRDPGDEHA